MEIYAAALSCLLMGAAAFLACGALLASSPRRPRPHRRAPQAKESLVSWIELLGHWVPLVRVSNLPAVAAFSGRLRPALAARGLFLSQRACVAFCACTAVLLMAACAVLSASLLGVAVGAVAAAAVFATLIGRHEKSQRDAAATQMPEVLRSLSAALGAGKSLPQAIEYVGINLGEPMGSEFLKASFEIKGGKSIERAVGDLCGRVDAPGIALLGTALQISQRTGSSLNDLFARTAHMVSGTVSLRRELQVKTSQVRLSAKIVAGIPVLLVCALTLLSPDYREGLSLGAGRVCLCVAALLDASALMIVQRLMRRSLS